ncbi:PD40 domain-containing protein [bacterium]|nr:PD40 domain-containing protein [bacterium]
MRITNTAIGLFIILLMGLFIFAGFEHGALADDGTDSTIGARYPSLSPDGNLIAFAYLGDVWVAPAEGGTAKRLTVHAAFDGPSCWSPDGNWIAFSSTREHNTDVFVVPSSGGTPTRLTFHSASDQVASWSPDGESILFNSFREYNAPVWAAMLFSVPRDGGLPTRVIDCSGYSGVISPDETTLAFVRGNIPWWRRGYRGSADRDLWLKPLDGSPAKRLTDFDGTDDCPMWSPDGEKLYFLSDRGDVTNVWVKTIEEGEATQATQVTHFDSDGLVHARIARDGSRLVCELDGQIYTVDPATGESSKVAIEAPSDIKQNNIERRTYEREATEMALSKDAKQIAFVIRGEVFARRVSGKGRKITMRLTDTPARESDVCWSPDGKKLAFCSDRNGNSDIFVMTSTDKKEKRLSVSRHRKTKSLLASPEEEYSPVWSPDGKQIAYLKGRGELWVADTAGKNAKRLSEGPLIRSIAWSPDSGWLAFSRMCEEWQSEVFVVASDGGEQHNITKDPAWDYGPVWDKDGKRIAFLSNRNSLGSNSGKQEIWQVFLTKKAEEKFRKRRAGDIEEKAKKRKTTRKKPSVFKRMLGVFKRKKKIEKPKLPIEFENIEKRAIKVGSNSGNCWAMSLAPDGKNYVFASNAMGNRDLYIVDEFGRSSRQLTFDGAGAIQTVWGPKSKKFYVLSRGGSIRTGTPSAMSTYIPFSAEMTIDHKAERAQMFDEVWSAFNTYFYDSKFHAVDWAKMREKYRPLLKTVTTSEEFQIVLTQMLGELRASHIGVWSPRDPDFEETGHLGLRFDAGWKKRGLRIANVVPDGPCDRPGSKLKKGDVIRTIDGVDVGSDSNPFAILRGKVDKKVDLEVQRKGRRKRELVTVTALPFWAIGDKVYRSWVEARKQMVEKWSDGKVGYIHVRRMNRKSYKEFLSELVKATPDKKALIVDVRYNSGGNLHDQLLSVLGRDTYFYFEDRDKTTKVMQPRFNWRKPVAVLINEYSHSDAETFPYGFRKLGLGKLIGVPTSGGVIYITGWKQLLDGTHFIVPQWGAYALEGETLEGMGIRPDIEVENAPEQDFSMTSDDQLKKAVESLLEDTE